VVGMGEGNESKSNTLSLISISSEGGSTHTRTDVHMYVNHSSGTRRCSSISQASDPIKTDDRHRNGLCP